MNNGLGTNNLLDAHHFAATLLCIVHFLIVILTQHKTLPHRDRPSQSTSSQRWRTCMWNSPQTWRRQDVTVLTQRLGSINEFQKHKIYPSKLHLDKALYRDLSGISSWGFPSVSLSCSGTNGYNMDLIAVPTPWSTPLLHFTNSWAPTNTLVSGIRTTTTTGHNNAAAPDTHHDFHSTLYTAGPPPISTR